MLMIIVRKLMGAVAGFVLSVVAVNAFATNVSVNTTTDDAFYMYISTNDSSLGNLVGSGHHWRVTHSFSAALTPKVTNYIHVASSDVYGLISGFIGDFSLNDKSFAFVNGTQSSLTNTTDWGVSTSGFGGPYSTPISHGLNGVDPWGVWSAGINSNANWIWDSNNCLYCTVYFSTAINSVAAVPEPQTYAMMLAGLGLVGFTALRRKQHLAV